MEMTSQMQLPLPTLLETKIHKVSNCDTFKESATCETPSKDVETSKPNVKKFKSEKQSLQLRRPHFKPNVSIRAAASKDVCPEKALPTLYYLPDTPDPEARRNIDKGCRGQMASWTDFDAFWSAPSDRVW
eukprot:TRINITY_DN50950_c0_g1_i1.p1 TRINITY_DN50950_c0_g1~~TRINITY_DN50950_c0_g1_i1.p1  ORF type:complete len:130 (+),score=17.87 TRINITY_DN50950_c0_g1_i1:107-496(+)